MRVAVIGAGWAGMAAALQLQQGGHQVTVYEASRHLGGRARGLEVARPSSGADAAPKPPSSSTWQLDNGQHILIGAYTETLRLIRDCLPGYGSQDCVKHAFVELPLRLAFPDGYGLKCAKLPFAINSVALSPMISLLELTLGIARLPWRWPEKLALLRAVGRWRAAGFQTQAATVAHLCEGLPARVMHELIEPLCVSALNTPVAHACAQVFLRVLQDALLTPAPCVPSHLLLPRLDLSRLFVQGAADRLKQGGGELQLAQRAELKQIGGHWQVQDQMFDAVVLATSPTDAIKALHQACESAPENIANDLMAWCRITDGLQFEAITTVYAYAPGVRLAEPMLALHSSQERPAQFVFDRGQLHDDQTGLLAFVVSASQGDAHTLQAAVLAQARTQLGLELQPVKTIIEKRATFACTPRLQRPHQHIAPGLLACGDYTEGPYPSTLEGAVRSGLQAARALAP